MPCPTSSAFLGPDASQSGLCGVHLFRLGKSCLLLLCLHSLASTKSHVTSHSQLSQAFSCKTAREVSKAPMQCSQKVLCEEELQGSMAEGLAGGEGLPSLGHNAWGSAG